LALDRRCLHWPLTFPEVFLAEGCSGFDAIVGNPPFLGGQRITGALGTAYRNYLVDVLAGGRRGSADFVSYFFLRAFSLIHNPGGLGLLATNTIAQGDTRDVGLDQLAVQNATITRAVASEPWPGSTALEVAKVWIRKGEWRGECTLAGAPVRAISPMLVVPGRAAGKPFRLKANENKSFQGSIVLGMGFVMTPEDAQALLAQNPRNRDVLIPYLNGEDLNSRPDQSASRWVINFHDWPLERSVAGSWTGADGDQRSDWRRSGRVPADYPGPVAADFPECLEIVRSKVKPERDRNNRAVYRNRWWHYAEKRPELYATIAELERVLVAPRVSAHHIIAIVPRLQVFADRLVVFALEPESAGVLLSTVHDVWAHRPGSTTHETRNTYFPEEAFETFPFHSASPAILTAAKDYQHVRDTLLRWSAGGLRDLYNRFHSKTDQESKIRELRMRRIALDRAVAAAYEWTLDLDHTFVETTEGTRFTIGPSARQEILDCLLELNHQRYRQEVAQGLHEKVASRTKSATAPKKTAKSKGSPLLEGV
jgi:hypothetical protein